jgi:hypothetical protein
MRFARDPVTEPQQCRAYDFASPSKRLFMVRLKAVGAVLEPESLPEHGLELTPGNVVRNGGPRQS